MPLPWLQVVDAMLGLADMALSRRTSRVERAQLEESRSMAPTGERGGALEARLAGVVVAALKEAFDRDTRRLDLEREQLEAERQRAERALRMELQRQAGDREVERMRLVAGMAAASWIGTLFFSARFIGGPLGARAALGAGWVLLLLALALAFAAQSRVSASLARLDTLGPSRSDDLGSGPGGALAPWLIVVGLGVIGLAVIL